jgi:hypothetical protein
MTAATLSPVRLPPLLAGGVGATRPYPGQANSALSTANRRNTVVVQSHSGLGTNPRAQSQIPHTLECYGDRLKLTANSLPCRIRSAVHSQEWRAEFLAPRGMPPLGVLTVPSWR